MARLNPLHLVPALVATVGQAGEVAIQPRPFSISHQVDAVVSPVDPVACRLDARAWREFEIVRAEPHGKRVAAGETVVEFRGGDLEGRLAEVRESLKLAELEAAAAEADLKHLSGAIPLKLEDLRRSALQAREEQEYFTATGRKIQEDKAAEVLRRARQLLIRHQVELDHLDDLDEKETASDAEASAVLAEQREEVAAAEFTLRMETLNQERVLKVMLPRDAEALAARQRETALELANAEQELPRRLAIREMEAAAARSRAARQAAELSGLEHDRGLLQWKAPADGWFFHENHGEDEDCPGRLVAGDIILARRAFATFVPVASRFHLAGFLDAATAGALAAKPAGLASLAGQVPAEVGVKILSISEAPGNDGRHRVEFEAAWPAGYSAVPGAAAEIRLVSYRNEAAIAIPHRALTAGASGWTVEVKLADGKTEARPVKRGHQSADLSEILEGLETGQVIVIP